MLNAKPSTIFMKTQKGPNECGPFKIGPFGFLVNVKKGFMVNVREGRALNP